MVQSNLDSSAKYLSHFHYVRSKTSLKSGKLQTVGQEKLKKTFGMNENNLSAFRAMLLKVLRRNTWKIVIIGPWGCCMAPKVLKSLIVVTIRNFLTVSYNDIIWKKKIR